jgi:hypothetical protein
MFMMLSLAIWRPESWIIGLTTLPVGLLPLWFVYLSFDMLSREWREKSIALLSDISVQGEFLLGISDEAILRCLKNAGATSYLWGTPKRRKRS